NMASRRSNPRDSDRVRTQTGSINAERIRSRDVSEALTEVLPEETRLLRASAQEVSKPMNYFFSEENLETMNVTEDMEIPEGMNSSCCKLWWWCRWHIAEDFNFTSNAAWNVISPHKPAVSWAQLVWHKAMIPQHATTTSLFFLNRNPTLDRLANWNGDTLTTSLLCGVANESREHLFFESLLQIWQAAIYVIWHEGNARMHSGLPISLDAVADKAIALSVDKCGAMTSLGLEQVKEQRREIQEVRCRFEGFDAEQPSRTTRRLFPKRTSV
ncbi:hypothetical protein DY000_02053872, partial [Brassica cretica]